MGRLTAAFSRRGSEATVGYTATTRGRQGTRLSHSGSISVDARAVMATLDDLSRYKEVRRSEIKEAHKAVGRSGVRKLRKTIRDYPRKIRVVRSSGVWEVLPGSLRKSITVIDPGDRGTNVWVGPKARQFRGSTPRVSRSDGWFAHFVEGSSSPFLNNGAQNINARWYQRGAPGARKNMDRLARAKHAAIINRLTK